MRTPKLSAALMGAVLMSLAVACDNANPPSAPSASRSTPSAPSFRRSGDEQELRWDIVNISAAGDLTAGGTASALAEDGSKITFTGSGKFKPNREDEASGRGTWTTFNAAGATTGSGTYRVRELVRFDPAEGTLLGLGLVDHIGNAADGRAGLAIMHVRYSDGSKGILVLSCQLGGTPASVFEGVTASKGFVTFWNRQHSFTLFHVTGEEDD